MITVVIKLMLQRIVQRLGVEQHEKIIINNIINDDSTLQILVILLMDVVLGLKYPDFVLLIKLIHSHA